MPPKPEEFVVDAWVALLTAKNVALGYVEESLKKNGLPSFSWYDVLWELEQAGAEGLRPFELEKQLLLTQYGLSRLLRRLEVEDYVQKFPCLEDKRGHRVSITKEGRHIRRKMWSVYSVAIQSSVGEKLTENQCRQLTTLLIRLQG